MQETIIETAGKIWEYLNENGEVTTKKMNKDLGLNENFTSLGLGWLAREDKVNFNKKGSYTKVSLRQLSKRVKTSLVFAFCPEEFTRV